MHLLALILVFAFAALTAISAAGFSAENRSRRALVPVRVKRNREGR